jgi:hypothetical protein
MGDEPYYPECYGARNRSMNIFPSLVKAGRREAVQYIGCREANRLETCSNPDQGASNE